METSAFETLTSIIDSGQPDRFRDALDTVEDMMEPAQKSELLDYCIRQKRLEEMSLVLLAGADPNARQGSESTPLLVAAVASAQIEPALMLLIHGADPNATDMHGDAAIHYAARQNFPAVIDLLGRNGADLGLKNGQGQDAFTLAAISGAATAWSALERANCTPGDLDGLQKALPVANEIMEKKIEAALVPEAAYQSRPSQRVAI